MTVDSWVVEPFDLADGEDLRDEAAVLRAMSGCEAVVHAGAIAHDSAGTPAQIAATNLLGTWHVLQAAEAHSVSRFVYFSSGQVFGFAEGEGMPVDLPADDATRCGPRVPTACPSAWPRRCVRVDLANWYPDDRPAAGDDPGRLRVAPRDQEDAELGARVDVDDVAARCCVLVGRAGRPYPAHPLRARPVRYHCGATGSRVVAWPGLAATRPVAGRHLASQQRIGSRRRIAVLLPKLKDIAKRIALASLEGRQIGFA